MLLTLYSWLPLNAMKVIHIYDTLFKHVWRSTFDVRLCHAHAWDFLTSLWDLKYYNVIIPKTLKNLKF